MKWITRARPKTDRIACPWLITKFIDPAAEILYVPAAQVLDTAGARTPSASTRPAPAMTTATANAPSRSSSRNTAWAATRR